MPFEVIPSKIKSIYNQNKFKNKINLTIRINGKPQWVKDFLKLHSKKREI